jgi:uncharacterized membrane protein
VKKILLLGLLFMISGLIITYLVVSTFLKINQTFTKIQEETETMLVTKKNMIYSSSLIGAVLIVIGFYLIKRGFTESS